MKWYMVDENDLTNNVQYHMIFDDSIIRNVRFYFDMQEN